MASALVQAAGQERCPSWYQLLDAFLRRLPSGSVHHRLTSSALSESSSASTDGHGCRAVSRDQRQCVKVQCQLSSTFSSAPVSQAPYDTRHGFCYGHLPANFGGAQLSRLEAQRDTVIC